MKFFGRRRYDEVDEEIRSHLALAIQDRIANGEDPKAAEWNARKELGNRTIVEESTRDAWGVAAWLDRLRQDVRYALRGLRRNPGFTAVAVLSLALGIGANTAIYSLLYEVMLRELPVREPGQLVELLQQYPNEPRGNGYWTFSSFEHISRNNHFFSAMTGMSVDNRVLLAADGIAPEFIVGETVLPNYFAAFGIRPILGRGILPGDNGVAVISWSLWANRFNRDPHILGKQVKLQDQLYTVVGVAPANYTGLRVEAKTSVWTARAADDKGGLAIVGWLKPGVPIEEARAEMQVLYQFTIAERMARSVDPLVKQLQVFVEPAGTGLNGARDRLGKPLTVVIALTGLVLLLACVNIASMLLARAAGREREMALRLSLGASRWRLVRQVWTESLVLSTAGAQVGALFAYVSTNALLRILASGRLHEQVYLDIHPNLQLLLFLAGVTIAASVLFGSAPAFGVLRMADSLRVSGNIAVGRPRLGRALVSVQVALSLLLLSAAVLFVQHMRNLQNLDLGFRRDHVLLVSLDTSRSGYTGERLSTAYQQMIQSIGNMQGVRSVSMSNPTPLSGAGAGGFATVEGFAERPEDRRRISISWIAPKYFDTIGTPLLAGREFGFHEPGLGRFAVINQTLAKYYFPGANPIGKHITMDQVTLTSDARTYEIVGVAADANYLEIREPARRALYIPAFREGRGPGGGNLIVRTAIDPESLAPDIRKVVNDVAPGVPVSRVTTLNEQVNATITRERLIAMLSGFFGVAGALLAGIGLYGLLAYTVARRTNEIGVRMALGASARNIVGMVLRDASAMVIAGLLIGIPIAVWASRMAMSLVQGLDPVSPAPLIAGGLAIAAVGFAAAYLPARRASRVDPMVAVRHE